ncbi:MAG: peptide chain release factor 1 [Acetobacteraceae bacterium]|nr:peptide chain release factor 1 [Acetobacteraceae bacterium]
MQQTEYEDGDLTELDRLLNDPDVPMQASRVWELLDKVASRPPQKQA